MTLEEEALKRSESYVLEGSYIKTSKQMTPFPLKFRVWSKATKKWLHSITLTDTGVPLLFYVEVDKETKAVTNHVYQIDEYEPVIQWVTGIKDKEGRDIYEGDIVKFILTNEVKEIMYEDGSFGVLTIGSVSRPLNQYAPSDRIEIIGNILENPDLIKLPTS